MLKNLESISETQIQVKKQRISREKRYTSKDNNYNLKLFLINCFQRFFL